MFESERAIADSFTQAQGQWFRDGIRLGEITVQADSRAKIIRLRCSRAALSREIDNLINGMPIPHVAIGFRVFTSVER
jgi:hypothetical protein